MLNFSKFFFIQELHFKQLKIKQNEVPEEDFHFQITSYKRSYR